MTNHDAHAGGHGDHPGHGDQEFALAAPVEFRGRRDTPEDRLAPGEGAEGFLFASVGPTVSRRCRTGG
jgi:hypothetical protein